MRAWVLVAVSTGIEWQVNVMDALLIVKIKNVSTSPSVFTLFSTQAT
jgi:hypothetical protein